jgi:AcrB/AcrD/AcrF family
MRLGISTAGSWNAPLRKRRLQNARQSARRRYGIAWPVKLCDLKPIIGLIMLIGIVKKNAIMMIDFALQRERADGKAPEDLVYEGRCLRFRPIMMTTMAALFGTLPIAIGIARARICVSLSASRSAVGLIVSQAPTLFTTPVTYPTWIASAFLRPGAAGADARRLRRPRPNPMANAA